MINLQIGSSGDLVIDKHNIQVVSEATCVRQRLLTKLRLFRGEYRFDITQGVDYFEEVNVKSPNLSRVASIFKAIINEDPEIVALTSFSLQVESTTRELKIAFTAKTNAGPISAEENL